METKEHYIYFIKRHTYVRATGDDKSPIETTQEVNEHRNKHFPPSCSGSQTMHTKTTDYSIVDYCKPKGLLKIKCIGSNEFISNLMRKISRRFIPIYSKEQGTVRERLLWKRKKLMMSVLEQTLMVTTNDFSKSHKTRRMPVL